MNYPDQQQQKYNPGYPPAPPQQGYPQYPPQYPPAPPQQGYPPVPPPSQGYPPQYPPASPQQPAAPLPKTTLADFTDQPGAGGSALQFPVLGHRHVLTVARPLGDGDFPPQTTLPDQFGQTTVKRFLDGRPMVRMVIPALVRPDAAHPDGHATLSVQGQMAESLKQAMAAAGAGHLKGVPEAGAVITVTWASERPAKRAGYNPQKIYETIYQRPPGAAPAPAPQDSRQPVPQDPPWVQHPETGRLTQYPDQPQPPPVQVYARPETAYQAATGQVPAGGFIPAGPGDQVPLSSQPQWPAPGAPLSVPPQPAPPGENPYGQSPSPAAQVAAAAQAGIAAAAQHQAPPWPSPENQALINQILGQQPPAQQ